MLEEVDRPQPIAGQVLIHVRSLAINSVPREVGEQDHAALVAPFDKGAKA